MTQILDHGYIKLVETWGSDERIIEAARMSTDKGFQGWGDSEHFRQCPNVGEPLTRKCDDCEHAPGDEKLLKYLYIHGHMTPFEMAGAIIEVQAPIFVFREWHRHRTQSYNELSARYTTLPDLFYTPSYERMLTSKQSTTNKQSSEAATFTANEIAEYTRRIQDVQTMAREAYEWLLSKGVAREVARTVIPVSQYSRMRASANLRNWLGFLTLRTDPAAQWEIRQYADALATMLSEKFPRTMQLWSGDR